MKKIISITESQLHNIVLETARYILNEAKCLKDAVSIFTKKYPNIDQEELAELMQADPTAVKNDRGAFIGKYGMWIGNQYVNGNIHRGDISELRDALNTYNINKSRICKGIAQYSNLDELVQDVAQYDDRFRAAPTKSKWDNGEDLEKVYEDESWVVYVTHTWDANRHMGHDTHWCTASSSDKYFNYYKNKHGGEYYVNVKKGCMTDFLDKYGRFVKKVPERYQFHFESDQFMDVNDRELKRPILDTIGATDGLNEFYKKMGPDKYLKFFYDEINDFVDGYACVQLNGNYNFIDTDSNLLCDGWFDYAYDFNGNYAKVNIDGDTYWIDTNGKLYNINYMLQLLKLNKISSTQIFDEIGVDINNLEIVKLNNKFNWIKRDGDLLWKHPVKEWFNLADMFDDDGYARVMIDKNQQYKYNWINTEGKLLWDYPINLWFDKIEDFHNGYAMVKLKRKLNWIGTNGKLLWDRQIDDWFDFGHDFKNGYACVEINHKMNFICTDGKLLWKHNNINEWFDWCGEFQDGYAKIELDGKWNFIGADGNIVWNHPVDEWFDWCGEFHDDYAIVKLNDYYYLDTDGNLYDENKNPITTK